METDISKLQAQIEEQESLVEELQLEFCTDETINGKLLSDAEHDLKILRWKLEEAIELSESPDDE